MKRIVFSLMCVLFFVTAGAQTMTKTVTPENKKVNNGQVSDIRYLAEEDGLMIAVTNDYSIVLGNYMKRCIMALAIDKDMNVVRSVEIPESKRSKILATSYFEGNIYILTSHKDRNGTIYERFVVDSRNMQMVGEPKTIFTYNKERKDDDYVWASQSPNKTLTGLIHITTNRKSDKFEAVEILLDEEMNIEWQREYPIYSLSNMFVTDDGELITIGRSSGSAASIYISVVNEANAYDISAETPIYIDDVRLVSIKNGKILGLGYGSTEENIAYFGISANVKTQETHFDYKTISDMDRNVFANKDQGKKSKSPSVDRILLKHSQATDFGAVATIQNRWVVEVCDQNGACRVTSYQEGVLIFGVDVDGNITWHHAIRSSLKQKGFPTLIANAVCVEGDDVYFIQSEKPNWPATYTLTKKLSTFKVNGGSKTLGVYHIGPNGSIAKSTETLDKSTIMTEKTIKSGDSHIGFLSTGRGASMIKMKF